MSLWLRHDATTPAPLSHLHVVLENAGIGAPEGVPADAFRDAQLSCRGLDVIAHDLGREHLSEALRALQGRRRRRDHRHLQACP
jgi:hypothetical protein